jgi:hypothetical protein
MRVARLAAAGLLLGAAGGFVLALLRPRTAIEYRLADGVTLPDAGSRPMIVLPDGRRTPAHRVADREN